MLSSISFDSKIALTSRLNTMSLSQSFLLVITIIHSFLINDFDKFTNA